jgi:putative oxidoreductase
MNSKINDLGLLILRLSFGGIMLAAHGLPKLLKLLSGKEIKFFDPFGIGDYASFIIAVLAEFIGAILLSLGIFTRLSALSLAATMFVAGFIYHTADPFPQKEKAFLFLAAYLVLLITGPGKFSFNNLINRKLNPRNKVLKFLSG